MKILLVYPAVLEDRIHEEDISVVPMGLYYVGALLEENQFQVRIVNGHELKSKPDAIQQLLIAFKPEVIGFSILQANRWGGIEVARLAKQLDPAVRVVFGGIGATYLWKHLLTHFDVIDYVVTGEGEYPFLNLVRSLESAGAQSLSEIDGIAYRKQGQPTKTRPAMPIRRLDDLPDPAKYFAFRHVALTRGCGGKCTFCGSPDFWGRKVRFHSADYFVGQLARLNAKGIDFFYFCDDTFTMQPSVVIEICRKIIARNLAIRWVAIARVDHVDEEVLAWMRKAGCHQISYGIESGSAEIRRRFGKSITTDQIERAFSLTVRYGILARAYFIYAAPGETWQTIAQSLELIRQIKPLAAIFYILALFPGTALYAQYQKKAGVSDDIWLQRMEDILYFETDPALSREMVLEFGKALRTEYHRHLPSFARAIELVDDPDFNVLHADFLSRLAMTFSHGDYARIETPDDPAKTAEHLYRRALTHHPDHRACLGLGILCQKSGRLAESIRWLEQGLIHYPHSRHLNICLGVSLMNGGQFQRALDCFEKFPDSEEAMRYSALCRNAMGDNAGPPDGC